VGQARVAVFGSGRKTRAHPLERSTLLDEAA
jgi:hypothetical protein